MSTTPKLKMYYFAVRARSEAAKMIMAAGKIPYEEKLINGAAFKALKDGGKCPFDQLPVMEIGTDGTVLADSGAICRYLAKMGGLYPSDPIQAALSEEAFEVSQGCASINPIVNVFKDDVFAEKKAEYFTSFAKKVGLLSKRLGEKKFFAGVGPTLGDFGVMHVLDMSLLLEPTSLDTAENLKAFVARMREVPGLKEYLETRPDAVDCGTAPMLKGKDGEFVRGGDL